MEQVHAHGAPQPILGFICIDLFFHIVSTCPSKLRQRVEMMVRAPASFRVAHFWVQQGSLLFDRYKTYRQTQNTIYIHIKSEVFSSYFSPYSLNLINLIAFEFNQSNCFKLSLIKNLLDGFSITYCASGTIFKDQKHPLNGIFR